MIYFCVITGLMILLCFVLLLLFFKAYARYKRQDWTKLRHYFMPTALALLITFISVFYLAPRCFDLIDLAKKNFEVSTVEIAKLDFPQTLVGSKGENYHYSAAEIELETGKTYQLYMLPRTKFVVQVLPIDR